MLLRILPLTQVKNGGVSSPAASPGEQGRAPKGGAQQGVRIAADAVRDEVVGPVSVGAQHGPGCLQVSGFSCCEQGRVALAAGTQHGGEDAGVKAVAFQHPAQAQIFVVAAQGVCLAEEHHPPCCGREQGAQQGAGFTEPNIDPQTQGHGLEGREMWQGRCAQIVHKGHGGRLRGDRRFCQEQCFLGVAG